MGLADQFAREDRVDVKFSDFYNMMKSAAAAELLTNAVNCGVPHKYIRDMITGKRETEVTEDA